MVKFTSWNWFLGKHYGHTCFSYECGIINAYVGINSDLWRICFGVSWLRGYVSTLPLIRLWLSSMMWWEFKYFFVGVLVSALVFYGKYLLFLLSLDLSILYTLISIYCCRRFLLFIYKLFHSKKIYILSYTLYENIN